MSYMTSYLCLTGLLPLQEPNNDSGRAGHVGCQLYSRHCSSYHHLLHTENIRLPLPPMEAVGSSLGTDYNLFNSHSHILYFLQNSKWFVELI